MPEKTQSFILTPDGNPATIEGILIDPKDAQLLRQYKTFLAKYHLREALYCQDCWNGQRHDGCEAHVTTTQIVIKCRCKLRTYSGSTL